MSRSAVGRIGTSGSVRTYSDDYKPSPPRRGLKKTIHIHQQLMRKGEPAIIVKTYKKSIHARKVQVTGGCELTQLKEPDSCGARIILTTYADVWADGKQVGK